jgi:hypothetical protein
MLKWIDFKTGVGAALLLGAVALPLSAIACTATHPHVPSIFPPTFCNQEAAPYHAQPYFDPHSQCPERPRKDLRGWPPAQFPHFGLPPIGLPGQQMYGRFPGLG